jgi:hypothetical protein
MEHHTLSALSQHLQRRFSVPSPPTTLALLLSGTSVFSDHKSHQSKYQPKWPWHYSTSWSLTHCKPMETHLFSTTNYRAQSKLLFPNRTNDSMLQLNGLSFPTEIDSCARRNVAKFWTYDNRTKTESTVYHHPYHYYIPLIKTRTGRMCTTYLALLVTAVISQGLSHGISSSK